MMTDLSEGVPHRKGPCPEANGASSSQPAGEGEPAPRGPGIRSKTRRWEQEEAVPPPPKIFFLPSEVAQHVSFDDAWVSLLGHVFDPTKLVRDDGSFLSQTLCKNAGRDITHWFDPATENVKTYVDPVCNLTCFYTPQGRFIHVPPSLTPTTTWKNVPPPDWWKDPRYCVGRLSLKTQRIRMKNVLTDHEIIMEAPCEETAEEIQERYLHYNRHSKAYTWKAMRRSVSDDKYRFKPLDMKKTLAENGIQDYSRFANDTLIPAEHLLPIIYLYFNDDLTVA
ncbi:hypothetical protein CBR_g54311 [Chara braunii]|uniref:Cytochrome b5 heme-binding domain-containing protein n=1 Tax=Chara braunii TaxID=69332 RepID=A0A388MBW5_CHABU|nr:hypothetical protein CBR_g54311 [Chara braunii]|eukprot:GBG92056.1 hypothetical protein CBR_g54311 [Chara braunii]